MAKNNKQKDKKPLKPAAGTPPKRANKSQTAAAKQPVLEKPSSPVRSLTPVKIAISTFVVALILFLLWQFWLQDLPLFSKKGNNAPSFTEKKPFPAYTNAAKEEIKFTDFLGSEACAECHTKQYQLWKESTHGKAGGPPNANVIIGKFDSKPRNFKDATVVPQRTGAGKYVFNLSTQDLPSKIFTVDAVVGGGHMIGGGTQTYFSEFPDGTYRFLPFDFIRKEQVWFGETNQARGWIPISKDLSINDLSEWPPSRILGAHLLMDNCQECHGSQIQVKFDTEKKKYNTQFKSLSINCESCHGPGRQHVEIAKSGQIQSTQDIGMRSLATLSKDESLGVCFRCHALKDVLEPGYLQGKDLEEHYAMKFPMLGENPYHADGRIKAFGYQQNHLSSDCYLSGSMTCVDCHDPHSQDYRDITGKALSGPFDDGQCTGCHGSKAVKPELHTFHKPESEGSKCVSCHMPYLQHQAMGKDLQFARSDHTIPIPRPAFDAQLGIDNACAKCHRDKTTEWLQAKTTEWYGELKPHKDVVAHLMQAEKETDRKKAGLLLLNSNATHPMAQMAGLSRFVRDYLQPDMPALEPEIVDRIKQFVENPDLDIQSLALASLHLAQDNNPEIHHYLTQKLTTLDGSKATKVRRRWAMALPYLAKRFQDNGNPDGAIRTYQKALEILPNHPAALINLGYAYQAKGDWLQAIQQFEKALKIDPNDAMAWVNLGNAHENNQDDRAAIQAYKTAIDVNPWNAIAHYNLGNYYYRGDLFTEAIQYYAKAIELDPSLAVAYFNLTKAYIQNKEYAKALQSVKAGLRFDPGNETGKQMLADLEKGS